MKKRRRWGGGGRARRTIFNYAENALAEMATVLRKDATILIRLREKMEVHFRRELFIFKKKCASISQNFVENCSFASKMADLKLSPEPLKCMKSRLCVENGGSEPRFRGLKNIDERF